MKDENFLISETNELLGDIELLFESIDYIKAA